MIVSQKIAICTANSVSSITSVTGFRVILGRGDLQESSDGIAGRCVSNYMERNMDDTASIRAGSSIRDMLSQVLQDVTEASASMIMDPLVHAVDGFISYCIGVVKGTQSMVQAIDSPHCHLPNFYMHELLTCACGDKPAIIPPDRQQGDYRSHEHWCSGTLLMTDGFGEPVFVFNPFSYTQLKSKLGDVQSYLRCLSQLDANSGDCHSKIGKIWEIENQGVSSISVLQRCKANYQQKRWDMGAFLMYDREKFAANIKAVPAPLIVSDAVGDCLLKAEEDGVSNLGCLQDFVQEEGAVYWKYDMVEDPDSIPLSGIDACLVFSGPASDDTLDALTREKFQNCTDEKTAMGCTIPPTLWAAGSINKVSVATEHAKELPTEASKRALANLMFQEIHTSIMVEFERLRNFEEPALDVVLFSAEGDSLHQIFDCVAMGPYARMDLWTQGSKADLPVPFWSRDEFGLAENRDLDLPCSPEKLKGDSLPPFTCGSETRRSVIKYFVRDEINSNEQGNSMTEALVREQIEKLIAAWDDPAKYACQCPDQSNSLDCCIKGGDLLPDNLDVSYDEIPSDAILDKIMSKIPGYWEKVFTEPGNERLLKYTSKEFRDSLRWETSYDRSKSANADHLYAWQKPVMFYNETEIGSPLRYSETLWETCTGLLSQVLFTMPIRSVGNDSWTTSTLSGSDAFEFDPVMSRSAFDGVPMEGRSVTELYVDLVLKDAYTDTATFWHHLLRYVPSDSLVCKGHAFNSMSAASGSEIRVIQSETIDESLNSLKPIPILGQRTFSLGNVASDCFCGWNKDEQQRCIIPDVVCQGIGDADCRYTIGTADAVATIKLALAAWGGLDTNPADWSCPALDLSDAWGILPQDAARQWVLSAAGAGGTQVVIQVDIMKILADGRAGLRIGNINTLSDDVRVAGLWPSKREHLLQSEEHPDVDNVAMRVCKSNVLASVDLLNVATQVVDDLFPVANAAREGAPMAVCLRFVIEYARLRIMRAFKEYNSDSLNVMQETTISKQESLYTLWRGRCEAQLQMVGMCRSNSVFNMIPAEEKVFDCPFVISDDYHNGAQRYYVTPGCLVYVDDKFYDPCRMTSAPCSSKATVSIASIIAQAQNELPFDPRTVASKEVLGTWPLQFSSHSGVDGNARMANIVQTIKEWEQQQGWLPWRLSQEFVDTQVMQGGALGNSAVGNVPSGKAWGTAEGFADQGSAQYCDSVVDW